MIRPGLCSITFRKASPEEIIARVARAGLASIEWGGDIHVPPADPENARRVGQLTREAGLAVASYGSYYTLGVHDPEKPAFPEVLAAAVALGAPLIRVWAGNQDASVATEETWDTVTADALGCADLAAAAGVRLGYEWHGGTLTADNENAHRLLNRTIHSAITAYWQPKGDRGLDYCLAGLCQNIGRVSQLHVFHWAPGYERQPLSAGAGRWRAYLRVAAETGRSRDALLEFAKDDSWDQFEDDARVLRELIGGL